MSCSGCCNGKYKNPQKCAYYNEKCEKCSQERKVIDISEGMPHKASEVICVKCGERWIAIRPEKTMLRDLECPKHHVGFTVETGEELEETYGELS